MKATIYRLEDDDQPLLVPASISFARYLQAVAAEADASEGLIRRLLQHVLRSFERYPVLKKESLQATEVVEHPELLRMVQATVYPLVGGRQDYFALATPFSAEAFFVSSSLDTLFTRQAAGTAEFSLQHFFADTHLDGLEQQFYQLVLERFYQVHQQQAPVAVIPMLHTDSGLPRYVQMTTDLRFVDLIANQSLPSLPEVFLTLAKRQQLDAGMLKQWLPLHLFEARGFSILRFSDVTNTQALDNLQHLLQSLEELTDTEILQGLQDSLQVLLQHAPLRAGIIPLLQVNGQYVYHAQIVKGSLLPADTTAGSERRFKEMAERASYQREPLILEQLADIKGSDFSMLLEGLESEGFQSYAFFPLWYSDRPVGILEIASPMAGFLTQARALDLVPALDIIGQIMRYSIEQFEDALDAVIKSNFTALQPTIEWKFNEVAWNHLAHVAEGTPHTIEEVFFEQVIPYYGAIDIRNSSGQRNLAFQQDYLQLLDRLQHLLQTIAATGALPAADLLLASSRQWYANVADGLTADEDTAIRNFLAKEVDPFLVRSALQQPDHAALIQAYFSAIADEHSELYHYRQQFEASQETINETLLRFFDAEKRKLEKQYPVYVERFRTDGLEYNLFAGSSISPQMPRMDQLHAQLQAWQVRTMAKIAQLTGELKPTLPVPLETTQLIISYHHPINIHFRRDEKRFDVEGSQSIGFELMKKRMDKAVVKTTGERLTLPHHLCIVFTHPSELQEYLQALAPFQQQGILDAQVETVELADLQGLQGLRAVRVRVLPATQATI